MLIGFLPFVLNSFHLDMAAIAWEGWPSYVKGVRFSVLDALALALYFSLPSAPRPLPFRLSMVLYFLAVLLSTICAEWPEVTLFYSWQLARMFLVYAVVARACADPCVAFAILKGMAVGIVMEAGIASWQRFGLGIFQATGSFDHQNLLGMMSQFVTYPYFALLLAGRGGRLSGATILSSCVVAMLSVSRATIGLVIFGFAVVFTFSAVQQWTTRKVLVLLIGVATVAVLTPLVLSAIEGRRDNAVDQSDAARTELNSEAMMILSDYPFGIGANQYVIVAQKEGYRKVGSEWGAPVHNTYLLVAAETGYVGLITFVIFLFCPLALAFRCGWRNRRDLRGQLMLGLGVALLSVYIQSFYEWVFLDFAPQYMFALELGLVAGLAQQLGYWRHPRPRGTPLGVRTVIHAPAVRQRLRPRGGSLVSSACALS
jgi:O-antigen ligase